MLNKHLIVGLDSSALAQDSYLVDNIRLTVISDTILRIESGHFTDEATQIVWKRTLKPVKHSMGVVDGERVVTTPSVKFVVDNAKVTYVVVNGERIAVNNKNNLLGTRRTLDGTMGKCKLEYGVMSKAGVAVMKDDSLILDKFGMIQARPECSDEYIFVGKDYKDILSQFYELTGKPPMVPRAVLGNWWSRYYAYTQQEYLDLVNKFENKDIPFTVATIDMDWHYVNLRKHFGIKYLLKSGWTGYSVDKTLLPDHKEMFSTLHKKGMLVTLNLHPAKGVRKFETQYPAMCEAMGVDPSSGKPIEFDFTDENFINAYFDKLHRPLEKDGVDFWWIDWQQGKKSKLKGYDPLWALNHYHTLDNAIDNKRPMVLSRYAKLGSHRYPVGFSGDTFVCWNTLKFQPYFTANATNCGYVTWSHDIGGHLSGKQKNDELYLRWIQFGIFSPISRLHSTKNALSKEPWNHPAVEDFATASLRFRHRLIPYTYTAYHGAYADSRAICEPLYYNHGQNELAYNFPNEYYFGSELLVLPITDPIAKDKNISEVDMWLPQDIKYVDIFTKQVYQGGKVVKMQRGLDSIPVLAKAGAIIPLSNNKGNDVSNPASLELMCCSGNGSYTMYEDDSTTQNYINGVCAKTTYTITTEGKEISLVINPTKGDVSLVPAIREYSINILDMVSVNDITVAQNGNTIQYTALDNGLINIANVAPTDTITVTLKGVAFR